MRNPAAAAAAQHLDPHHPHHQGKYVDLSARRSVKAGNCDDVAWNWPYAPPKALHPWWCSNFLDLLLSSFTLKNLPALPTSFFPPREKKQRLFFLLSVLFLLFWIFFSPLPEAPNFSVIPKNQLCLLVEPRAKLLSPPHPP
jgi:hypothetical protein